MIYIFKLFEHFSFLIYYLILWCIIISYKYLHGSAETYVQGNVMNVMMIRF
jgi:hypothetical protein